MPYFLMTILGCGILKSCLEEESLPYFFSRSNLFFSLVIKNSTASFSVILSSYFLLILSIITYQLCNVTVSKSTDGFGSYG
jgi:hypothetical protein